MHYISGVTAAILFALSGSVSAETNQDETIGMFLVHLPARSLDPVIDFCGEKVPEIKNDLLAMRAGLIERLNAAGKPLIERLKNDPEFNAPVQESLRQEIAEAHSHALTILKQQDPGVMCRNVLANMQYGSVDELRKVVEDTYEKYRRPGQVVNSKQ